MATVVAAAGIMALMCWQLLFVLVAVAAAAGGAREHAPSIIFMDEVDSIGSARTENSAGGGDSEVQRTMLELLNQLDGFEASNKIKVKPLSVCVVPHLAECLAASCCSGR